MSEELEKMIMTLLEKGMTAFEATGEFAMDQAPELVSQFYMWVTAVELFWCGFAILIWITTTLVPLKWLTSDKESGIRYLWKYGYREEYQWAQGVSIGGFVISSAIFLTHLYNLIFIYVAPKIYLIEYFFKLTSGRG